MTETTDITTLPPAERALIVLSSTKTEADLLAMVEEAKAITAVKDKTDRELAHRTGMKLKSARTTITKTGKTARDDATAFCQAVIAEEKRLVAITESEEKRVIGLRDAYDEKLEAEKRAAEAKRAEIKGKIDGIRSLPVALAAASSEEIAAEMAALDGFTPPTEVFGEQIDDCISAISEALTALADLHARAMAKEAAIAAQEAARRQAEEALAAERAAIEAERAALAAERAELAALRAAAAPVAVETGAKIEPVTEVQTEVMPEIEVSPEVASQVFTEADPAPAVPTDWRTREFAIHTAAQFSALAGKVEQCGFGSFAESLRAVATSLRDGTHDAALASADHEALLAADTLLLDATVEAIDVLSEEEKVAA
jgi:hypothetical protein